MKSEGKLEFGTMPMLEIDGKKLVQTQAIMNYVGSKCGYQPSDLLMKHKGEKIWAYWGGDILSKMIPIFFGKEEDRPALVEKLIGE